MSKLRERVEDRQTKKKSPVATCSFLLRFEENRKKGKTSCFVLALPSKVLPSLKSYMKTIIIISIRIIF